MDLCTVVNILGTESGQEMAGRALAARALLAAALIAVNLGLVYFSASGSSVALRRDATDEVPARNFGPAHPLPTEPEALDALTQIRAEQKIVMNPLVKRTIEAEARDWRRMWNQAKVWLLHALRRVESVRDVLATWLFAMGGAVLLFMFIVRVNRFAEVGYLLARTAYRAARLTLIAASVAAGLGGAPAGAQPAA
jgi:hypothetical protein